MSRKPKLKAKTYLKRVRFERTLDFREFKKRAEAFLPEKRADQLAFDLMEIDDACETFRRDIKLLFAALRTAKRDSLDLWDKSAAVQSNIHEFRNHFLTAFPALSKLMSKARELPPINSATDFQMMERTLSPFDELLAPFTPWKDSVRKMKAKKRPTNKSTKRKKR